MVISIFLSILGISTDPLGGNGPLLCLHVLKQAAGVDKQTIAEFEKNLKNNLYTIWNRMSSGS